MSDVADRYEKLASAFLSTVRAVPADAWGSLSPCEGWTARDVVRHVVETTVFFAERATGEPPNVPSVDDGPVAAMEAALGAVSAALADPDVARRTYETPMGESTLEKTIDMFGCGDLLVHRWDVARAVGLDDMLDPDETRRLLERLQAMGDMVRGSGAFGPAVPVPDDADDATKLLGFTGRDPAFGRS